MSKINQFKEIANTATGIINTKIVEALSKLKGKVTINNFTPGWGNIYDHTGNKAIGRKYTSAEITFTVEVPSSHPSLKNPISRNVITWKFVSGTKCISFLVDSKTDSIDVNYITHKKESSKNITLGRALKRKIDPKVSQIISELNKSLNNDITLQYLSGALEYINTYEIEKESVRILARKQTQQLCAGTTGLHLRKRTYYFNEDKIGTEQIDVINYLFNNKLVEGYNATKFPLLAEN